MKKRRSHQFISRVVDTIRTYGLFQPGARLLLGLSGGPDSLALLHVLHGIAHSWKLHLRAVHVNHQLRGKESEEDERFVREMCRDWGIRLSCRRIEPLKVKFTYGGSLEAISRAERYRVFSEVASETRTRILVLGHHKNDLAETVLMRLIRGAGSSGLSGFAPKTYFGKIIVVRPFCEISRKEILSYLKARGARWRVDSSNADRRFLRNKIRLQLLPYLERHFNPAIADALARSARLLQEDDATLTAQTERLYAAIAKEQSQDCVRMPLRRLKALSPEMLNRVLHYALRKLSPASLPPEMEVVSNLAGLVRSEVSGEIARLHADTIAYRGYDALVLVHIKLPRKISKKAILQSIKGYLGIAPETSLMRHRETLRIDAAAVAKRKVFEKSFDRTKIQVSRRPLTPQLRKRISQGTGRRASVEYFDLSSLGFPLSIRTRQAGDLFQPFGAPGKKKLKDFFIDQKIPPHLRSQIPLLCQNKTVLWVIGYRRGEIGRIKATTRHVLRVAVITAR
jgi:tRNA(Ile)-lysidine synthase